MLDQDVAKVLAPVRLAFWERIDSTDMRFDLLDRPRCDTIHARVLVTQVRSWTVSADVDAQVIVVAVRVQVAFTLSTYSVYEHRHDTGRIARSQYCGVCGIAMALCPRHRDWTPKKCSRPGAFASTGTSEKDH